VTHECWIKFNGDGACTDKGQIDGCGGIFRGIYGRWINGYVKKVGEYDSKNDEYMSLNRTMI